jgi:hypothetical protein
MARVLAVAWALCLLAAPRVIASETTVPLQGTFRGRYLSRGPVGLFATGAASLAALGDGPCCMNVGFAHSTVFFRVFRDGATLAGPADLALERTARGEISVTGVWHVTSGTGRFAEVRGGDVQIAAVGDARGGIRATLEGSLRF